MNASQELLADLFQSKLVRTRRIVPSERVAIGLRGLVWCKGMMMKFPYSLPINASQRRRM